MKFKLLKTILNTLFVLGVQLSIAQTTSISGKIISEGMP
jgi:hypothetical protein